MTETELRLKNVLLTFAMQSNQLSKIKILYTQRSDIREDLGNGYSMFLRYYPKDRTYAIDIHNPNCKNNFLHTILIKVSEDFEKILKISRYHPVSDIYKYVSLKGDKYGGMKGLLINLHYRLKAKKRINLFINSIEKKIIERI